MSFVIACSSQSDGGTVFMVDKKTSRAGGWDVWWSTDVEEACVFKTSHAAYKEADLLQRNNLRVVPLDDAERISQ
jgi:hypothetical protein